MGDKSSPEDIASYFHGISKKDFKNAIGSLYREGLVSPGGLVTSLVADENIRTNKITAEATKKTVKTDPIAIKIPRVHSERDSSRSVFIGTTRQYSILFRFFMYLYLYTVEFYVIPYDTILYYSILYYTILYYTILYYTVLYYAKV